VSEIRPIDPAMHAAPLRGRVLNPGERMIYGQSIVAHITLPVPEHEVAVPIAALVEDGQESVVFVQPDPGEYRYVMRHVSVLRRTRTTAYLRSQGQNALDPKQRVVVSGALILWSALKEREEDAAAQKPK